MRSLSIISQGSLSILNHQIYAQQPSTPAVVAFSLYQRFFNQMTNQGVLSQGTQFPPAVAAFDVATGAEVLCFGSHFP